VEEDVAVVAAVVVVLPLPLLCPWWSKNFTLPRGVRGLRGGEVVGVAVAEEATEVATEGEILVEVVPVGDKVA
jgi:hypothetical protein